MDTLLAWSIFEKSGIFSKMREKLKKRENKNLNDDNKLEKIDLYEIYQHLSLEYEELILGFELEDYLNIQEECADLANMCCWIYSKIEALKNV